MTGLADVAYRVGAQRGFRAETRQNKVEAQQDEDRSLSLARNAKTDTFVDETRAHTQEQWKQESDTRDATTEGAKLRNQQLKQKIEDEGALDFLYEIDAGGDPASAARRHNARGVSRMDEGTVKYDPTQKTVSFDMDSNGDGQVEPFTYHVPQMISALEHATGKGKSRYITAADGTSVFDTEKGAFVANNPKDPTGRGPGSGAPVKVGPKDRLWDPATKKFITSPLSGGGAATSSGITKFNPQTYYNDVSNQLGKYLGGKYDPASQQWDFGGATAKVQVLNRIAQGEAQRLVGAEGAISAPMIATVVAQAADHVVITDPNTKQVTYEGPFDPDKIRAAVKANVEEHPSVKTNEPGMMNSLIGLGKVKPDVLKKLQDAAVQNAIIDMGVRTRIALDGAYQRGGDPNAPPGAFEGEPGGPAATDEAEIAQEVAGEQGVDENGDYIDPTTTAADYQPAVDPVTRQPAGPAELATPPSLRRPGDAGALPPDAPPREKLRALKPGQGLRKGNVIWYIDGKGQLQKKAASGD